MQDNNKTGNRILVVDDEEIVHASLRRILTRIGHEVETVSSAEDGISRLKEQSFNLVTVDLMMPEMNGLEFLETLGEENIRVPVIMITGYPTIHTAVQALRLGAVDYIAKPFTRKELISPVQRALSMKNNEIPTPGSTNEKSITKADLRPGVVVVLPRHAWAEFQQDGTFTIGADESFLEVCPQVTSLTLPEQMDLIEQGYIGIYLKSQTEAEHGVAMPLSGQVVAINNDVVQNPTSLNSGDWLVRIIPSHLDEELSRLVLRTN